MDDDFVADRPGRHDLDLEALLRRAMALAPDGPGIHGGGDMPERRQLVQFVEILQRAVRNRLRLGHGSLPLVFLAALRRERAADGVEVIMRLDAALRYPPKELCRTAKNKSESRLMFRWNAKIVPEKIAHLRPGLVGRRPIR